MDLDGSEITIRRSESDLVNLVTNAMLEAPCADVALLNSDDSIFELLKTNTYA